MLLVNEKKDIKEIIDDFQTRVEGYFTAHEVQRLMDVHFTNVKIGKMSRKLKNAKSRINEFEELEYTTKVVYNKVIETFE